MRLLATLAFQGFGAAVLPASAAPGSQRRPTGDRIPIDGPAPRARSGWPAAGGPALGPGAGGRATSSAPSSRDHGARHPGITSRVAADTGAERLPGGSAVCSRARPWRAPSTVSGTAEERPVGVVDVAESVTITDNRTGESDRDPDRQRRRRRRASGRSCCPERLVLRPGVHARPPRPPSAITELDGDAGILRYRGYPIEQLAEQSTYLEVAYLLIHGELPTAEQYEKWKHDITYHTFIHENVRKRFMEGFHYDAHPMGMLVSAVAALSTFYPEAKDIYDPDDARQADRPAHRQDADARRRAPTASASACRSSTRTTTSTSPRTSCR